jgi:hypothetical protein
MAWAGQGRDPFAGLTGDLDDFYNDGGEGSRTAFDVYLDSLGLTQNARRHAKSLFGDVNRGFGAFALGQDDPTASRFTSWLSQGGSQSFLDQYNNLSAQDRGFDVGRFRSGRVMF